MFDSRGNVSEQDMIEVHNVTASELYLYMHVGITTEIPDEYRDYCSVT